MAGILEKALGGGLLIMWLSVLLLLFLVMLLVFRSSAKRNIRTLVIITVALLGSVLFAGFMGAEMGGFWGLVGLVTAFLFLVPRIRELINELFPPERQNRK
jgi:hypothetical protein